MPRVVQQVVILPAAPRTLYSMYLDPEEHAAFTGGGAVRISATPGSQWSAFDGRIQGRMLAFDPDRLIVQAWRSFEWQETDLDSILVLTFWPEAAGSRVELTQANVPDHVYQNLVAGWPTRYWHPWQAYLERGR
jgi:activator of HSP90 ATPase